MAFRILKRRAARLGAAEIAGLSERDFHLRLEAALWRHGYRVQQDRDGSALLLVRGGVETLLRVAPPVDGVDAETVQEAALAMERRGCGRAVVVARGGFTASARRLARASGVELWDGRAVRRALSHV